MSMKIYLSGKITGDPDYKAKFAKAEQITKERIENCVIINPSIMPEGLTQADYMRISLAMLDSCDTVLLLDNWQDSEGAKVEKVYADKVGKNVMCVKDLDHWRLLNRSHELREGEQDGQT